MKLTEHFSFEELTRTDHRKFADRNSEEGMNHIPELRRLADFAEGLRMVLNVPLQVTSGYRCAELNRAVGGSATSQHCCCEAIDFVPLGLCVVREAFVRLKNSNAAFGQLILEKRDGGFIIHAGMGTKRQLLYSPRAGAYEPWKE